MGKVLNEILSLRTLVSYHFIFVVQLHHEVFFYVNKINVS